MSPAPERLLMIVDIDDGKQREEGLGVDEIVAVVEKGSGCGGELRPIKKLVLVSRHLYEGLPLLGIKWQWIANPYMHAFLKMEHDQEGILITEVMPNYPESVILKPYDVILSIDGININNYGTVDPKATPIPFGLIPIKLSNIARWDKGIRSGWVEGEESLDLPFNRFACVASALILR
ncbi:hypothetical protein C3L33_07416, partial [Rhododendron williamsianum]